MPARIKTNNTPGLTDLEQRFCFAYARSLNASQAVREAGYKVNSDNSASTQAARLLRKATVRAYLSELLNLSEVTVVNEVVKIAFATITDAVTWDANGVHLIPSDQLNERGKAAIKKVKVKTTRRIVSTQGDEPPAVEEITETEVEMYDRLAALEKLMKKLSLYPKETLEVKVMEAVQAKVTEEVNMLFEVIASTPNLDTDAKRQIMEAIAQVQERAVVGAVGAN